MPVKQINHHVDLADVVSEAVLSIAIAEVGVVGDIE